MPTSKLQYFLLAGDSMTFWKAVEVQAIGLEVGVRAVNQYSIRLYIETSLDVNPLTFSTVKS